VAEYSHGMRQKVGLVQALQHDPAVVILDEPTEGLDPLVQETFFALVSEASEAGRTVFLSSHVLSEVQRACERVAIVRGGRLVTVKRSRPCVRHGPDGSGSASPTAMTTAKRR
jgi:ABC-2 type transport system ATP-binding protein